MTCSADELPYIWTHHLRPCARQDYASRKSAFVPLLQLESSSAIHLVPFLLFVEIVLFKRVKGRRAGRYAAQDQNHLPLKCYFSRKPLFKGPRQGSRSKPSPAEVTAHDLPYAPLPPSEA